MSEGRGLRRPHLLPEPPDSEYEESQVYRMIIDEHIIQGMQYIHVYIESYLTDLLKV